MLTGASYDNADVARNQVNAPIVTQQAAAKKVSNYFPWKENIHEPDLIKYAQSFKVHKRTHGENADVKWGKVADVLNGRDKFARTGVTLTASAAESKFKKLKKSLGQNEVCNHQGRLELVWSG